MQEITASDVRQRLDAGEKLRLIDVREPHEFAIAKIDGAELIPMRAIPGSLVELQNSAEPLIIFCHHGVRSMNVVQWLAAQGVESTNLRGGIDEWSRTVDPSVPRY
jgi:rhodanese-related sulfurtransferase